MRNSDFFKKDRFAYELLGIEIVKIAQGYTKVKLKIEDKHLNGVNITQGGVLFTLADYAMAIASNAQDDITALTTNITIHYLKPTTINDILTAEAKEVSKSSKLATYNIEIFNEQNEKVAIACGNSYIKR